jgi:NhaP-type Na+/H+ or K+/H+ antiporter
VIYNFVSFSFHAAKGLVRISLHKECFKLLNIIVTFSYTLYFEVMLEMFVSVCVRACVRACERERDTYIYICVCIYIYIPFHITLPVEHVIGQWAASVK